MVERAVDRHAEPDQLLLDAPQAGLYAVAVLPHVAERMFEHLGSLPPLVPFLHAQQDRVHVDHRGRTGETLNQPFGAGGGSPDAHV